MVSFPSSIGYNPAPEIQPQTSAPRDQLTVRASPEDFGAQIGRGLEKIGQAGQEIGQKGSELALKQLQYANEAAANQTDADLYTKQSELVSKFNQLRGADAVAARPTYIAQMEQLRLQARQGLNVGAARMFDSFALRRQGQMISEMTNYADAQFHQSRIDSFHSVGQAASDSAGNPVIAKSPALFQNALGDLTHSFANEFALTHGGVQMNADGTVAFGADGKPVFTDPNTSAIYSSAYTEAAGNMWIARFKALADPMVGNINDAIKTFKDNFDQIPVKARGEISRALYEPYANSQTAGIASTILSNAEGDRVGYGGANVTLPAGPVADAYAHVDANHKATVGMVLKHETSGYDEHSPGSDGKFTHAGLGQFDVKTWEDVTGEHINPEDVGVVGKDPRLDGAKSIKAIQEYADKNWKEFQDKVGRKPSPADLALLHQQGPGAYTLFTADPNARADSVLPAKNLTANGVAPGATVGQAIHQIESFYSKGTAPVASSTPQPINPATFVSKADWYEKNAARLEDETRTAAEAEFGPQGREDLVERAVERVRSMVSMNISAERQSERYYMDQIGSYIEKNGVVDIGQMDNLQGEDRTNWLALQENPYALQTVQRWVQMNSKGLAPNYGSQFYNLLGQVASGNVEDLSRLVHDSMTPGVPVKDQALTNSGFRALQSIFGRMHNPDGSDNNDGKMEVQGIFKWLNSAQVKGAIDVQSWAPGVPNRKADDNWGKFIQFILPQIKTLEGQGMSLPQVFQDKSILAAIDHFKPGFADRNRDMANRPLTVTKPATKADLSKITNMDQLNAAAGSHSISFEDFEKIYDANPGWRPQVPTPH